MKISEQYRQLQPYVVDEIRAIVGGGGNAGGATLSGVPLHGLADLSKHSGTLAESQAPWAVTQSTFSAHTGNANAHHDTATAGTLITVSGQQISLANGTARYQVPMTGATPFAPAWTALSSMAGNGLSFASGTFVVGVSGLGLSTNTTQVVLSSSSNPGAAAAILATDGDGTVQLATVKLGTSAITLNSTDNVATKPDIQFGTNGLVAANSNLYLVADATHTLGDGAIVFAANDSKVDVGGTYYVEIARFTESGRLGIGDASPSYELDVTGTARATVALRTATAYATTKLQTPRIDTASGDLTLAPADDLYLSPGGLDTITSDASSLRSDSYLRTILIAGYRIGPTSIAGQFGVEAGSGEFDELRARTFVADETRVDRGQEYITKSYGVLSRPFTAPTVIGDSALIYFENSPHITGALFTANDWVMLRYLDMSSGIVLTTIWGQVNTYTALSDTEQRWQFYLRSGSTSGLAFATGALCVNFGASGAGYILSDAVTATSPYIQVGKWTTNPYTPANYTVLTEMGRLDGVGFTGEYGIAASKDNFTTAGQWFKISTAGAQLNNIPLTLWSGGTQRVNIDQAGTNVWFKDASGNTKLSWDGSTLAVTGQITATSGTIAKWNIGTIDANTINSASGAIKLISGGAGTARLEIGSGTTHTGAGIASRTSSTGVVFWAGEPFADIASAPFQVTNAGKVTATSVNITAGGSGVKDSTLNGWNIDTTEIVGQLAGVDQVVLDTSGRILAGAGKAMLDADGVKLAGGTTLWQQGTALEWYGTPASKTTLYGRLGVFRFNTGLDITRLHLQVKQVGVDPAEMYFETLNAAGAYVSSLILGASSLAFNGNTVYHAGNLTIANYAPLASPAFSGTPKVGSSTIWHAGNDGSGSGLDADYLDGHDTSYFSADGHTHAAYAALSGATFTGYVTLPVAYLNEQSSTPSTNPSDGTQCNIYMRNDKLVIGYNKSGTMYWVVLNLNSATLGTVTWSRVNAAP